MKTITVLLFSWIFLFPAIAQNTTTEYKISKEWKAEAGTVFELVAKYQKFRVEFWDKNSIHIDFVLATSDSKINEEDFRDALKISGEKTGNKFTVNTSLNDISSTSIWSWIFGDKKNKNSYTINNVIYLPRNLAALDFTLNYTDIKIGEMNLPAKIKANYSDLSILRNSNRTVINATYSDLKFGYMSYLKLGSSYSDLISETIDTLSLSSSYDDIKLLTCGYLQSMNMNYGDISIEKSGYIKATATYSDIRISGLTQEANAILTYSDLKVNEIGKNISGISITGTYSDCTLNINSGNPVILMINDVNGSISLKNTEMTITKKHETSSTTNMTAKTRSATDASPVIKINSNSCDLRIN